jgi:hypothetical protein
MPIEVAFLRRLLGALRSHPGRIRLARNTARPELCALDIILGKRRLNLIGLRLPGGVIVLSTAHAKLLSKLDTG